MPFLHTSEFAEQSSNPSTPSSGTRRIFPKSDGWYDEDDSGTITKLGAGSATDSDAIHDNVAGEIIAITEKTAPVDADVLLIEDSEDSNNKKRLQIGSLSPSIRGGEYEVGKVVYDEELTSASDFDIDLTDIDGVDYSAYGGDIEIIVSLRTDRAAVNDTAAIAFNSDTTASNYEGARLYGGHSTGNDDGQQNVITNANGNTSPSNKFANARLYIYDYTNTGKKKEARSVSGFNQATNVAWVWDSVVFWNNTDAITRITLTSSNGTDNEFVTGSRVTVKLLKPVAIGGGVVNTSDANVSNPPTDAELDSAFGTPATVGNGYTVLLNDNGDDINNYLVLSNGTSWLYTTLTKAT